MILLIDNYDSFTYNLVQRIGELLIASGQDPESLPMRVVRNDRITVDEAIALEPSHVIVSPGPCTPREAGISVELIKAMAGHVPLLGVCLGHQSIGHAFGMTVGRNIRLMHGKTSKIHHDGKTVFANLPNPVTATRYHSLVILPDTFDEACFEKTAWTDEGEIMGMRIKPGVLGDGLDAPLEGVQFHPESFLTPEGPQMLANFLNIKLPTATATA